MTVSISALKKLALKALKKQGYSKKEAEIISGMLFYAQLRGNNQGLVKLIGKGIPKDPAAKKIRVQKNTKLSTLLNGNHNAGAVVMTKALEIALKKAKAMGFGIVGTNNTCSSTGALGYWARQIADKGFIGFVFAGSPETVNTHGSYQPIFGTNPLAIAVPTKNEPLVLDMATAAMAYYGLIEANAAGRKIPEGIAYDSKGKLTIDPAKAMDGAIRPFDRSYKGAGLALMVEILTGPLVAASFAGVGDTAKNWGNLIMAINPTLLVGKSQFISQVDQLAKIVKKTKKMPGVKEILLPGERGDRLAKKRKTSGKIEIEDNLYTQLVKAAA